MVATVIDGKAAAAALRDEVGRGAAAFEARTGRKAGLAVVLVGEDLASQVYVRNKAKLTVAAGMASFEHRLAATVSQAELLALVARLNAAEAVDGLLVQLPLPAHIDTQQVIEAIDPAKDVDGFHPVNVGRLATGGKGFAPCTPLGCLLLLQQTVSDLRGMEAVVIGRSNVVGKPMAQLLLVQGCTVTIAHSATRDLAAVCRRADILIVAVGRPEMVRGDWIKPGAVVVDVGINRLTAGESGRDRLVGDLAYDEVRQVAGAVTPVPGGVGPMTIACLLKNSLAAADGRWAGVQSL